MVVTNTSGAVTSAPVATLVVNPASAGGTATPTAAAVCDGGSTCVLDCTNAPTPCTLDCQAGSMGTCIGNCMVTNCP